MKEAAKLDLTENYRKSINNNVDKFADDLINNTAEFMNESHYISRDIMIHAKSLKTVQALKETLQSDEPNVTKKLEKFRDIYDKPETRNILLLNPDSHVKEFFKKAGYFLANVLTLGTVHAITKGSTILSPQQKLNRDLRENMRIATREQIIKSPIKPRQKK
jgi:hypothetical protein